MPSCRRESDATLHGDLSSVTRIFSTFQTVALSLETAGRNEARVSMVQSLPSGCRRNELSLRHDQQRFALMFTLFTSVTLLAAVCLFHLASQSYQHASEAIQGLFLPYALLAALCSTFFLIFLLGSLVYANKSLRKLSSLPHRRCSLSTPATSDLERLKATDV